ncbi:MAG: urease accessory protein UreD [Phycisphaerae bacterium]
MTELLERSADVEPAGAGRLVFEQVAGRTCVVEASARCPLRLLTPSRAGVRGWAFTRTFGGGLLAGDCVSLEVEARAGTTCYLSTQSSTKVYRSDGVRVARQSVRGRVEEGAVLVCCPDPLVCFEAARYEQVQRFELVRGGSLVLLDWFTSGRQASGERWKFERLVSRNEICVEGKRVVEDVLRLDHEAGALAGRMRGGDFHCYATLILIGERVRDAAAGIHRKVAASRIVPVERGFLFASSVVGDGVIVRVAGARTEEVAMWLRERLGFLEGLFGEHPWRRKW